MSTVRVYKSTDSGAPPHPSATRGSMAALLRACLVTGYGSGEDAKAPAGWEEPLPESNNYACFRALTGNKLFYQIDDNLAAAYITTLNAFDSMSDVTTGVGLRASTNFGKRSSTVTTSDWFVVADEKTCYVSLSSRYGHILHGFGEYFSLVNGISHNNFVLGHNNTSQCGSTHGFGSCYSSNPGFVLTGDPRATVDMSVPQQAWLVICYQGFTRDSARYINGNTYTVPDPAVQGYMVECAWFSNWWDYIGCYRGKLRGAYMPQAYLPKNHGEIFSQEGKTFLALKLGNTESGSANLGQAWIDITGSWEESL